MNKTVYLEEICNAMQDQSEDLLYFYHIPTGKIAYEDSNGFHLLGEEGIIELEYEYVDEVNDDFIGLPGKYEINDYGIMKSFIEKKTSGQAKEWLENAIVGRGAFRMFRATCDRFGLTNDWYDFRDRAYRSIAIQWCDENAIPFERARAWDYEEVEDEDEEYEEYDEEEFIPTPSPREEEVHIVEIHKKNYMNLIYLVKEFRAVLASLKNQDSDFEEEDGQEELEYYLSKKYPIFAASLNGQYVGYAVCRIEDDVVWLESIYVRDAYRRKGIASKLFARCEAVAEEYGNDTIYNYVHPNNDAMLLFLEKNGYDVLNLIEIRKKHIDEETNDTYTIGQHTYRY